MQIDLSAEITDARGNTVTTDNPTSVQRAARALISALNAADDQAIRTAANALQSALSGSALTMRDVIVQACSATLDEDARSDITSKTRTFSLAVRAASGAVRMEVSTDEASAIKARIAKAYPSPVVVARAAEIIERNARED